MKMASLIKKITAVMFGLVLLLPAISVQADAMTFVSDYGVNGGEAITQSYYTVDQGDAYTVWAEIHDGDTVALYRKILQNADWEEYDVKEFLRYTPTPKWDFTAELAMKYYYKIVASGDDGFVAETPTIVVDVQAIAGGNQPHLESAPTVTITDPEDKSTLYEDVAIDFRGWANDKENDKVSLLWEFGDGKTSSQQFTTHTYSVNEDTTYTVKFTATDEHGASGSSQIKIKIIDVPVIPPVKNENPVAILTSDITSGSAPLDVEFDISESSDTEDGKTLKYVLEFGDGTEETSEKVAVDISHLNDIEHTYASFGTYTAKLTIMDSDGAHNTDMVTIRAGYYYHQDYGDGGGGGGTDGGVYGGTSGYGGIADGKMTIGDKYVTINAGESASVSISIQNDGNAAADYEIELGNAEFGSASISQDSFELDADDSTKSYVRIRADKDAEGQYVLKVKLYQDGEQVDTANIYVTVKAESALSDIFVISILLVVALGGLGGLGYVVYTQYFKRKSTQIGLEKYY